MQTGELFVKVGGQYLKVVSGGGSGGGGGGGVVDGPDAPPENPSQWDDEFEGDTFNPDNKWSPLVAMGTVQVHQSEGRVYMTNNGQTFTKGFVQNAPVGEFTITFKIIYPALPYPYMGTGIYFDNPIDEQGRGLQATFQGNSLPYLYGFKWNKADLSWGGDVIGQIPVTVIPGWLYLRVKRYLKEGVMQLRFEASWDYSQWSPTYDGPETNVIPNGISRIGFLQGTFETGRGPFRAEFFRVTTP